MKVIAACITFLVALFAAQQQQFAAAAVAAGNNNYVPHVGLYAPDRYDGIPEMCLMPMDFGYCRAKVKRYYFDMRRMKCAMFYWGGCAGNINNFKSLDDCNKVCIDSSYDYQAEDDSGRNLIHKNSSKNNNNNNNRVNANSSKNSNNENSSSSNYKTSNRRLSDNAAASNEKNENVEEEDGSDYTNN